MRLLAVLVLLGVIGCAQQAPLPAAVDPVADRPTVNQMQRPNFKKTPYPVDLNISTSKVIDYLTEEGQAGGFGPMKFASMTALGKTLFVDEECNVTFIPTLNLGENLASAELVFNHKSQPEDTLRQRRFEAAIHQIVDNMGITDDEGFQAWLTEELAEPNSPSAIYIDQLRFDCSRIPGSDGQYTLTWKMSRKPEGLPQGKLF